MGLSSNQAAATGLDWSQDVLRNGGLEIPKPGSQARNQQQQRQHWPPLLCPRCESNNTKFCYYNNYSKSQPRHFCKTCRRHWTEGGTLRNVPVGGGRKNKRQKNTPTTSTANPGGSSAGNNDTNASIINSGSVTAQPQRQRKPSLPFAGDHSSRIFPEILRQVLLRPPPPPLQAEYGVASSFVGSLPAVDPPLPPQSQFAPTKPVIINSYTSIINPFSISTTTSSSSSYPYVSMEGHSTSMDASIGSSWQMAPFPPPVPVSAGGVGVAVPDPCSVYWSGWEDDIAGFVPTELRLPNTNSDKTQQP